MSFFSFSSFLLSPTIHIFHSIVVYPCLFPFLSPIQYLFSGTKKGYFCPYAIMTQSLAFPKKTPVNLLTFPMGAWPLFLASACPTDYFSVNCSPDLSFSHCFLIDFPNSALIFSYYIHTSTPERLFSLLHFFPFPYPIRLAILNFGGIFSSIWI